MYTYEVHSRVCFFGDSTCTQSGMNSTSIVKPELICRYYNKYNCEKANKHSYCEMKDQCYLPYGCKVGYYKRSSDICSIATYSIFTDYDLFECGKPITTGGETCGAIGYGDIYSETGFDKKVQVFTQSGNKIECYASSTKEKCDNSNPHGECGLDMCGNWYVKKCKKGYGYYWRSQSGCLNGINYDSDENIEVCIECNTCTYDTEEECLEKNHYSKCVGVENCYNVEGCKDGFVSIDDNSEICKIGTYEKLIDVDENGCGIPATYGSGGSSFYLECDFSCPYKGCTCLPIARGNYLDKNDIENINNINDWFGIVPPDTEGAFDTQQNCEITTERGKRECKNDACGRWTFSGSACNKGYVLGDEECLDGSEKLGEYDGTGCYECKCIYKDKLDCEKTNFHSVCEENENGCALPVGCEAGYFKEEQNEEICSIVYNRYPVTYTSLYDTDDNGCGAPGQSGSGGASEYWEALDGEGDIVVRPGKGRFYSDSNDGLSYSELFGETGRAYTSKEKCEVVTERGKRLCKSDKCGYWIYSSSNCNEGYVFGGEECPDGMVKDTQKYDGTSCYKCIAQCEYETMDACEKDNYNSVCKKLNDECYGPVGCEDGATHITSYENHPQNTDKNGCHFECDKEVEEICKRSSSSYYLSDYPNSRCVTNESNCKVLECKGSYKKECPDGFTHSEAAKVDNNGCGTCVEKCTHTSMEDCLKDNFNSVCKQYGENCYRGGVCKEGAHYNMGYAGAPSTKDLNGCTRKCNSDSYNTLSWCEGVYKSATCGDDGNTCYAPIGCKYKTKDACEQRYSRSYCEQEFKYGEDCYLPNECKPGSYKTCPDGYIANTSHDGNGCHGCKKWWGY